MTKPYISSILRRRAERMGYTIELRLYTTTRPKGWPQHSTRPIHLLRDGKHVASFTDVQAAGRYLVKFEDANA